MGNSSILGIIRTGTTTKGTNATTETTVGNNAITENNGTPASNSILGNSATTGNNSTWDYKITLETKHVLGNNATMGNNNAVTGNSAITETKILGISNIMGNSTIAEMHIYLGSKTRVTNSTMGSTTAAGTLRNKSSESNASMGNNVTTGNQTLQNKNILGSITTDRQAPENSDILGSHSITEMRATESSGTSETNSTTGTRATQNATWGTNAITPESVSAETGTQESVSMGISTPLGNSTSLGTSATTENKILENIITENTAVGNSFTTESRAILESRLTTENPGMGSKISENVTLGNGTTRNSVSTGISGDTLGNNATMLPLLGSNVTTGSANTGSKGVLAKTISPLEEDTRCRDSGINETALCRGELSSGESAKDISLRDFICQKRAQGSLLNRGELDVRLSRAKCKDQGIIQTLVLIFSYVLTELQDILVQLNGSLCHAATRKALWTLMLQGRLDFKDTPSLRWWFQGLLQPFLTSLSRDERCFPLNTLNCKQYQAL
ncbi:mucin-22-like isoform X3 [Antechinus flavipes]|nr:mucin-22-like isoform X3 [Antechinus flavipes]